MDTPSPQRSTQCIPSPPTKYDNHPSIIQSSVSYRVLLPNNLLRIKEGDNVILVVDVSSYGFKKSIRDFLDDDTLALHSREQLDESKYEFSMVLKAFSIRNELLAGSISVKEQILRYNQGDGITLWSNEYPGLIYCAVQRYIRW